MQVGLSTASYFSRCMTEDALTAIVKSGVPVCEVFLNTFSEYVPSFVKGLRARLDGTRVHAIHAMSAQYEPQLFSINKRQKDDAFGMLHKVLDAACTLGAGVYVMHGPLLLMGAAKNLELGRVTDVANEVAECCARRGVRLGWENVSYCVFNEPEFPCWIEKYGLHDNLGFTLDIKQAARRFHDPAAYLDAIGKRIANVHVCDYRMEDGRLRLEMPTRGGFDFMLLMETLKRLGYGGPLLVEVYSDMYDDEAALNESVRSLTALARTF